MGHNYDVSGLRPSTQYSGGTATHIFERENYSRLYKEVRSVYFRGRWIDDYTEEEFRESVGGDLAMLQDPAYGIAKFLPPTELVWTQTAAGKGRGMIAMERVHGQQLSHMFEVEPEMAEQVDDLLSGTLALARDHSDPANNRVMTPDLVDFPKFINIMVGTTADNPVPQPYLIDTYPALVQAIYGRHTWDAALSRLERQADNYPFEKTHAALDASFSRP